MTLHDTLNDDERLAGLDLAQLEQLVGLVEYDPTNDPFPVIAQDYVGFVVGNATQTAQFYQLAFGMDLEAYRGPENGCRDSKSYVLRSGSARFVFTGGVTPDSPVLDHHRKHGDGGVSSYRARLWHTTLLRLPRPCDRLHALLFRQE